MSGQETLHLEMSMEEVVTLIRQINVDKGVQDLRFDLRAYSIKEILNIRIGCSDIVFNPSISRLSSEASRTTCTWGCA